MATINIVSTSSAKTSRKDECIQKLSDIQSDFDAKIVELHATKEEDHMFFQICQELGQHIDSYDDEMKDCYEGDFIYIHDAIKKMLKDELTKTPNYIKCIKKLMPDIKKQVQREKETKDYHNEEKSFKETVIQLEEEVNKMLEIAEEALETEQLEKQVLLGRDQKDVHEQETTGKQGALESSSNASPSLNLDDSIPGEPRINVLDHGSHKSEEIDTKDKSTLDHSENVATYSQQNGLLPISANAISDLKDVPNAQNLDNAGLSSADSPQSDELNSIPKKELPCKEVECSIGVSSQYEKPGERPENVREMTQPLQSADHEHQSLEKQAKGKFPATHTFVQAGISEKDESLQYDKNSAVHKTFNGPEEVTTRTRDTATNEDSDIGGTTVLYDVYTFRESL
ncbi:PIR Superfamily Protein [Plasmodium ovale wallikeri]|uniref:PIR Superfamily Protein n=1 Tax=Plasmodium ovale wallikeri TaxID=864142 RepID=A0A1A9AH73_PLAOA|nr:PIR Superfamily Protein [Plasmodium ovale wallikeri]SBT58449.1 PIR Superfamily Protein [Plasmodium ovale wallikeri]